MENDKYVIQQMKNKDVKLEALWFLSDLDLLESFINRRFVIDSHESLPITQMCHSHPRQRADGAAVGGTEPQIATGDSLGPFVGGPLL